MIYNIESLLKNLQISKNKIDEISKKPHIKENIAFIMKNCPEFTKMHYSLACTAPKNVDIEKISSLIDKGLVKHEGLLRGLYYYMKSPQKESIEEFIKNNDYSYDEIEKSIESKLPISKNELLMKMKKEMPYADFRIILELAETKCIAPSNNPKNEKVIDEKFKWLEEGEISFIKKPEENIINDDNLLKEHLSRTGGKVVTRFPPEPNGQLHIGHVKAINLSFLYAEKFSGMTYLRFDDTNPKNEKEEHYGSIIEDVEWLGFKPDKITASSDYTDRINECTIELIKKKKAYCCRCSLEDIRNRRQIYQKERNEGRCDPSILSPYRNTSVDENLSVFRDMLAGKYKEGEVVVRFKMDLGSKNPLMLDLVGSRICNIIHPKKKKNFMVYPTYEFALCFSDSVEDVTHSFCSREFMTRQDPYHWVLRNLEMYEPVQWEFSKLNLSNTVLSKRKMKYLVENHGLEWDDPRLYTIAGMRRRGFSPTAINKFVRSVGITYSETVTDVKILENFVRSELNSTSKKVFCIRNPIELRISNMVKQEIKLSEEEGVVVNKTVFIDGSDFSETPDSYFHRLTPKQPVGLIEIGCVKFTSLSNKIVYCELCKEKPMKYIQWVADLSNKVALKMYGPLFKSFNPGLVDFKKDLNLNTLEIVDGYCDKRIRKAEPLDRFQFIRIGFFCCDKSNYEGKLAFNLTLSLKNSY